MVVCVLLCIDLLQIPWVPFSGSWGFNIRRVSLFCINVPPNFSKGKSKNYFFSTSFGFLPESSFNFFSVYEDLWLVDFQTQNNQEGKKFIPPGQYWFLGKVSSGAKCLRSKENGRFFLCLLLLDNFRNRLYSFLLNVISPPVRALNHIRALEK